MFWTILVVFTICFIIYKYSIGAKEIERRNTSFGGMKKIFPEFVEYYESNGFEMVEDSGSNLLFKKAITNNIHFNNYLFLGVESKFGHFAYGYIITSERKKIDGLKVEFTVHFNKEDVEMINRKIIGNLKIRGHV